MVAEPTPAEIAPLLEPHCVLVDLRVAWGEMDAFKHVNNTVYFRWAESARILFFDACGWTTVQRNTGIGPILSSTSCRFRIPLTYPDTVTVGTHATDIGEDRFKMLYSIVSHQHRAVAAEVEAMVVSFNYTTGQKAPLPGAVRAAIQQLQSNNSRRAS